ncbi:hypothetical protein KDU71_09520 [Carboxylicivirga sediminis]|uniref:Uncharacterized protein n=1 Tax=Carboxylicivirga sediminis TaxID=2006564 RepID=A0A941F3K1_9BACT|nr:hypothetical protein [Carboxylicivirga sediminis]MBR8535792.1 hypothetical protein [Carboxylicivirga sediminis]
MRDSFLVIVILFCCSIAAFCQEEVQKYEMNIKIELFSDNLQNWDRFLEDGPEDYNTGNSGMWKGASIEFLFPSKRKNIRYLIGTSMLRYTNNVEFFGTSDIQESIRNVGGAYTGIEYGSRESSVGLMANFNAGIYSASKTVIQYNSITKESNNSYVGSCAFGSSFSLGLNVRINKILFTPYGKIAYYGGNDLSFILPGGGIRLGYIFK